MARQRIANGTHGHHGETVLISMGRDKQNAHEASLQLPEMARHAPEVLPSSRHAWSKRRRCEIAFGEIGVAGLSAVHLVEEVQSEEIALWCKHQMLVAKHVNQRPKRL